MGESKLNNLGKFVDGKGETVIQIFSAPNALTNGDALSEGLYLLSETLIRGLFPDERGGLLGGEFGYGIEFENEFFSMFPDYMDCQCPRTPSVDDKGDYWFDEYNHQPDCAFSKPNFYHKASGFKVEWYKWIGRDMEFTPEIPVAKWAEIFTECYESIPLEARQKAEKERAYEDTPEYKAEEAAIMESIFSSSSIPAAGGRFTLESS